MRLPLTRTLSLIFGFLLLAAFAIGCAKGRPIGPEDSGAEVDGGTPDTSVGPVDGGPDLGPVGLICSPCEFDEQCPSGSDCVEIAGDELCLIRVDSEIAQCPRSFEAGSLLAVPGRFYCLPGAEGCCIDEDDDGYGDGIACLGRDCDDTAVAINPGASELCNGDDDDCDGVADNAVSDCPVAGCAFDGFNYLASPGAACVNGSCEDVTSTSCGLNSCSMGGESGDVCSGACTNAGLERDEYCIPTAHCELAGCTVDVPNGGTCDEDSDCESGYCTPSAEPGRPGRCCDSGNCCAEDVDCPGRGTDAGLVCDDPTQCEGTLGITQCTSTFQCETISGQPNDGACTTSIEANDCGPYPSVFCNGDAAQTAPSCPTTCGTDSDCDPDAHCDEGRCEYDLPNGQACDEGSDCISAHCQNLFCCAEGDCCVAPTDCPGTYSSAPVCNDDFNCQGTRSDATCVDNECGTTAGVGDDSACDSAVESSDCANFPSVFCDGTADQSRPTCDTDCTVDTECDDGAHCEIPLGMTVGTCVIDVLDGGDCDEASDCVSGHCANNHCCVAGSADCCGVASDCPSTYREAAMCTNESTCQGTRKDATCTNSICGTQDGVPDDTACTSATVASNCGDFPSVTCTGALDQGEPMCATSCNSDLECDDSAHCQDNLCEPDIANGMACTRDGNCASGNCANNFCCDAGGMDCCASETDCPANYSPDPVCDDVAQCQGTRGDATCVNFTCGTQSGIEDDSGCAGQVALDCSLVPDPVCTDDESQVPPVCSPTCPSDDAIGDATCVASAHCDPVGSGSTEYTCQADVPNGTNCDEASDCISGYCNNGFCCDGGDCCASPTDCPGSFSTDPVCDTATTCQGTRDDATCTNNQCGTATDVEDDSACDGTVVADTCGFFPSVTCTGEETQFGRPSCQATCTLDEECDTGAHCDFVCLPDLPDGEACNEPSDCISGHCQNGFCCAGGDCCATVSNCPSAVYAEDPVCNNTTTCQGTRKDAVCSGSICGTIEDVEDDSACGPATVSDLCGPFPQVTCDGQTSQTQPSCPTTCGDDSQCDFDSHCEPTGCVLDLPDGSACDEQSDCQSGSICNNGFCCSGGTCCSTATDCPSSFSSAPECDLASTCQGTRDDATCVNSVCGTDANIEDDSACDTSVVANTCLSFPSVTCNGDPVQNTPICSNMCGADGDCDANAHCDEPNCIDDLADGLACDEDSDCVSGHCQNGYCCSGGDCCVGPADCPAIYSSAPECVDASDCDGRRFDATCDSFVCGTSPEIDDDTACDTSVLADGCTTYPDQYCDGTMSQSAPVCPNTCNDNTECDASANCDGTNRCVSDGDPGDACTANDECAGASECGQNGYCCPVGTAGATNDCCGAPADCPASYTTDPVCDTASACSGTRGDAICTGNLCGTQTGVADDSGCDAGTLANTCNLFSDVYCNGGETQTAPSCATSCSDDTQCDPGNFCNSSSLCVPLGDAGDPCADATECSGGLACTDGYCCNSSCGGLCEACDVPGSLGTCTAVPNNADYDEECGAVSCAGWHNGWDGSECYNVANAAFDDVFCDGNRACQQADDVCPNMVPTTVAETCDSLCETPNLSTCDGIQGPFCTPVTPSPANMTCNSGVCTESVARCVNGEPQTCPDPTTHPNYGAEICDGLDNNCNNTVDDGGAALCTLDNANEVCSGMDGCEISSCTGGFTDADGLASNGCECAPDTDASGATCGGAVSIGSLSEDQSTTVSGNLGAYGDEDWFAVTFTDSNQHGFNIDIRFTQRDGGSNMVFELREGSCSNPAQTGDANNNNTVCTPAGISHYTFNPRMEFSQCEVQSSNGRNCNGEADPDDSPVPPENRLTRTLYLRVYRLAGTGPTCAGYTISLTNSIANIDTGTVP